MKFTASQAYLNYANGASKEIRWKVYARKTATLSTTLVGYSGWTDVTSFVEEVPAISSNIEYELGQFTQDSIELVGLGIAWWDANIFNASASEYIEIKIEAQVGLAGTYASDIAYMFYGFVDKTGISYDELQNKIAFSVFTPEDIGSRIAGEYLSTQFIELDTLANATNVQGVILQNINACFVTDVNIASYGVKVGVHTITYTYDSAGATTRTICFDDGTPTTITTDDTYYTLSNADVTQKVKVYVRKKAQMSKTENVVEKIIVKALGSTLPYQFYQRVGGYRLLEIIYGKIGVTSLRFDTLKMNTYDSRSIVSFIDLPPADEAVNGSRIAIESDGTSLYVSVGTKVYKRNMTTNAYTLLTTVTASHDIYKLIHNARNNHLWILFSGNTTDFKLRRLLLSDNTYSDVTLTTYGGVPDACSLIDYNYTGSSWKYGIVYTTSAHDAVVGMLRFIQSSDMSDNLIVNSTTLGSTIGGGCIFIKGNNDIRFTALSGGVQYFFSYTINASGSFISGGSIGIATNVSNLSYNAYEGRIYFLNQGTDAVSYIDVAGGGEGALQTLKNVKCIYYHEANVINYCIGYDSVTGKENFYGLQGATIYELDTAERNPPSIKSLTYSTFTMTSIGDIVYGISASGCLFQFHSTVNFYIDNADFEGKTLTDALHQTLTAFNLVASISPAKVALCYRRGNDSGTPQSSGNSLTLSITNSEQIEKVVLAYEKFALINVAGESASTTYNGSTFAETVLSDERVLNIQNILIPNKIIQDVAYYAYQFFKTSRALYTVSLPLVALFQYEPFDAVLLNYTTTKIQSSSSGVIYAIEFSNDGKIKIEALI